DEVEVNGIPFTRTGSRTNTLAAGADVRLTKLTTLGTRYDMTWVNFDRPEETQYLSGGWIHGFRGELGRQISPRLTAGAEYSVRTASVDEGERDLSFQDLGGVVRVQFGQHTSGSASAGLGVLHDRNTDVTHKGPYVGLGIRHELEFAIVSAGFQRKNVPSFGFGGASASRELRGDVTMPLGRQRMYVQGSGIWRHITPFDDLGFEIDTISLRSTLGYYATRWAAVAGVYTYTRQDSFVITGGEVDRHRIGVQVVVSQPVRIR
ncbi:MAG: hypothetical protein ACRD15_08950, partial [Vicinamibacterales bacterium]